MKHQQLKLKNNLNTLLIDHPGGTASSVQIWFRAGSVLEKKDHLGIAHFLEHMFFKGTDKRPGAALTHEVEGVGGEMNAFTSFDYTCYYINSPSKHLPKMVEILLDMIGNPRFKDEDITPEREVVFEEYRRSLDNPGQYAFFQLQKNCFLKGHKHPILGSEKTIKSFDRKQLLDFRKNFYNLNNALFVVAGDLKERSRIVSLIENAKLPEGPKSSFVPFSLKKTDSLEVHKKDVKMCRFTLCFQSADYESEEGPAEDLAINCLGHGETSRLYRSLVIETGLANSCSGSTLFFSKGGIHLINLHFPPEKMKTIFSALHRILKEALMKGLQKREVEKIKTQYLSSKIYDKETIESYAFSLGHSFAQTGNIYSEEDFLNRLQRVSVENVNQSLVKLFSRALHFGLQIPEEYSQKDGLKELEALKSKFQAFKILEKKKESSSKIKHSSYDKQVQIVPLKEGVTLLHRHNTLSPTFVMHAYIKGGLTNENKKNNGTYNLLSTLLTRGFKKTSEKEVRDILEENAASLNGFSGKNAYGLTLHGLSSKTEILFPLLTGALLSPSILSKTVTHEKEMIHRTLLAQEKNPIQQCFQKVNQVMFHGHPYALNLLGTATSLKGLTSTKLKNLHTDNLKKNEILITYCGNQSLEEVQNLLGKDFSALKSRKKKRPITKKITPLKESKIHIPFDREQTQIFVGFPIKGMGHKENNYLKMLTTHLGGQSSELFVEVRDRKGLCYTAQPIHMQALEGGHWGIYMASGHDKVEEAITTIMALLDRLKEKGLKKSEFLRIKKMIQGQDLINIQTNEDYCNIYSIPYLYGQGIDYFYENNKEIEALSYISFQENLKKILSRKRSQIVVGRAKNT